jgi:hypothetical protein
MVSGRNGIQPALILFDPAIDTKEMTTIPGLQEHIVKKTAAEVPFILPGALSITHGDKVHRAGLWLHSTSPVIATGILRIFPESSDSTRIQGKCGQTSQ